MKNKQDLSTACDCMPVQVCDGKCAPMCAERCGGAERERDNARINLEFGGVLGHMVTKLVRFDIENWAKKRYKSGLLCIYKYRD